MGPRRHRHVHGVVKTFDLDVAEPVIAEPGCAALAGLAGEHEFGRLTNPVAVGGQRQAGRIHPAIRAEMLTVHESDGARCASTAYDEFHPARDIDPHVEYSRTSRPVDLNRAQRCDVADRLRVVRMHSVRRLELRQRVFHRRHLDRSRDRCEIARGHAVVPFQVKGLCDNDLARRCEPRVEGAPCLTLAVCRIDDQLGKNAGVVSGMPPIPAGEGDIPVVRSGAEKIGHVVAAV